MHMEHGWFARHPNATVALVMLIIVIAPGAIEWII